MYNKVTKMVYETISIVRLLNWQRNTNWKQIQVLHNLQTVNQSKCSLYLAALFPLI